MRIESKAPTRVDLAGGTLDIWPLYLFHPGAVTINAAISRYASCTIETPQRRQQNSTGLSRYKNAKRVFPSFAAMVRAKRYRLPLLGGDRQVFCSRDGFTLTTDSEAPAGAGIGGSSAMAVAICAALDRFTAAGKSKVDWIHISRDAEANRHQRSYRHAGSLSTGIWRSRCHRIAARRRASRGIALRLARTRRTASWFVTPESPASTESTIGKCLKRTSTESAPSSTNLERISEVAQAIRVALEKPIGREAGQLMREEWSFRKRNLPTISTKKIDRLSTTRVRNGALAGKVCGAGGGGCVVLLIEPDAAAPRRIIHSRSRSPAHSHHHRPPRREVISR